jgi:AraC-like DNA-binding protein
MRLAEQGLREGKMSVSEVAESLGYESDSAFSNAFKRRTGMAPKHYQSVLARMDQPTSDATDPNPRHAS